MLDDETERLMRAKDQPLFEADGTEVGYAEFERGLLALGAREGDVLFVHSDVSAFGKLRTENRAYLMETICASLMNLVGDKGTVIMPTFTYSFCKGELYDVKKSKSTVGSLTEYFRQRTDVVRTRHPIFSVVIWGHDKQWYLDISRDSFGEGTIFGKLHHKKGKIISLGVPFTLAGTYVHYVEQMHGVPYRYMKEFTGTIRDGEKEIQSTYTYYVRYLDREVNTDVSRLEHRLMEAGLMRVGRIGSAKIWIVEAVALYEEGMRFLSEDIYGFLGGHPHDVSVL